MLVENGREKDRDFREVCEFMGLLQDYKGKRYGSAWCKNGEAMSILPNLERKCDRAAQILKDFVLNQKPIPAFDSEESLAETVGDLAVYGILWMTWIKKNRPEEYQHWCERIMREHNASQSELHALRSVQDL